MFPFLSLSDVVLSVMVFTMLLVELFGDATEIRLAGIALLAIMVGEDEDVVVVVIITEDVGVVLLVDLTVTLFRRRRSSFEQFLQVKTFGTSLSLRLTQSM